MKRTKLFLILLAAVLLLSGCRGESDPGETGDGTAPVETVTIPGTEDRAVLGDYLEITPHGEHDVRMLFLNVGKADAIFLRIGETGWMIDAGTVSALPMLEAGMNLLGLSRLDGIFITHTDSDHVGGLRGFLSLYETDAIYTSTISADWNRVEGARGEIPRVALDPGAVVQAGEGVWFEVLGPIRYNPRDDNNSLVLRLRVNGSTSLFCGDMMTDEEKTLMYAGMNLDCDLLKVGHHGKKDATSSSFLAETSPSVALICADKEEESDSAHKSIIKALNAAGAEVYITENTPVAYDVKVTPGGKITVEDVSLPEPPDVRFVSVSKSDQLVVLENAGDAQADLSGWWILSETGNDLFRIPDGTVLEAGGTLSVGCTDTSGTPDLRWNEGKVWHKTKEDRAVLIDPWGAEVDFMVSQ